MKLRFLPLLLLLAAFSGRALALPPAVTASEFINENAPYPSCHASTIAETSPGHLVAAWFGGTHERHPDVGIWVSRHENGRWQPGVEVANGIQSEGPRQPTWNPVLFQPKNGPLVLFYKVGPNPREWWGMMMTSADGGKTWSQPQRLPNGILGPIKNKPVELPDGAWLCPSSVEGTGAGWQLYFEITHDAGKTWKRIGPVEKNGLDAIQPSILFHSDNRLQALSRTRNGVVASNWSYDGGKSWTPLKSTGLPNPNSGTDAVTLADGRQLLVYNHSAPPPERPTKGVRYPLDLAISSDGEHWKRVVTLETEPRDAGYAYPAIIQAADGQIHVTYTWDRKLIKHVVVDPKQLDAAAKPDTELQVSHLKTEYNTNPLGIDTVHPRLYWRVASPERGQRQTAYQILAASSRENIQADKGDLWDTGWVQSDQTTHVRYTGSDLKSSQQVFWKVRAKDRDGKIANWSEPATWTMGILKEDDWQGKWITSQGATESLLLRKEFTVKPNLRRAIVHVCGLGQYELQFNGAKISDDILSPGWTNYSKTTLYDTYDVTLNLKEGANAAGLTIGNGMYNVVRRNRFVKFTGSFGALRAILHLRLEYADGTVEYVGTDDKWRTQPGPELFNSIYGGEDLDARLEQNGWSKAGFNDRLWPRAVFITRPSTTLKGYSAAAEPLQAIEARDPISTRTFPDGSVVYDFGQNASIMPRLRVSGPAGSIVRLTPSEVLNEDGTVYQGTMGGGARRGSSWWQFTKATDGVESYTPKFFYLGSRYLKAEVHPAEDGTVPAKIESLEGVIVHSSAAPLGEFATSNELLNRIRDLVRWAQRSNMVSVLTDCPHREKLGWLEQYHLNGPAIRYEYDVARIFTKGMNDMRDAQEPDGNVPTTAPDYAHFKAPFHAATEWGSAVILVPWQQYLFNGDTDLLRTHYEDMKKYFAYLEKKAEKDIVSEGLGDWYDLGPNHRPGAAQLTPSPVTATAFFFVDAELLRRIANLLGHPEDAKHFAARADRIKAVYNKQFFNAEAGHYATNSQTSNALPLVLGIVPPKERPRVLNALVKDVTDRGDAVTAGDVGFRYLLQALAEGGRSDVIYRMINQDEKPGYGFQLKKGATSLTEAWDANINASHNHFMLGQITEWFYKDLAGIDVDYTAPGFKKINLRPDIVGDLKWVEASHESLHGPIRVRWERNGNKLRYQTTIPANTTATLHLPSLPTAEVKESGTPAKLLRREGNHAIIALQSGTYVFESEI